MGYKARGEGISWRMGRPLGLAAIVAIVGFAIAAVVADAIFLVPVALLALAVGGYALVNAGMHHRIEERQGSDDDAISASDESIPSTHLIADDETPIGDTPEAHDEINPHDLPKDHPGRQAAEEEAGELQGTTRGSVDPPA